MGKLFLRKDGTYPEWFARLTRAFFAACWASYDGFFKGIFGDGERTIGDSHRHGDGDGVRNGDENGHGGRNGRDDGRKNVSEDLDEKAPLIRESIRRYGRHGRLDGMV